MNEKLIKYIADKLKAAGFEGDGLEDMRFNRSDLEYGGYKALDFIIFTLNRNTMECTCSYELHFDCDDEEDYIYCNNIIPYKIKKKKDFNKVLKFIKRFKDCDIHSLDIVNSVSVDKKKESEEKTSWLCRLYGAHFKYMFKTEIDERDIVNAISAAQFEIVTTYLQKFLDLKHKEDKKKNKKELKKQIENKFYQDLRSFKLAYSHIYSSLSNDNLKNLLNTTLEKTFDKRYDASILSLNIPKNKKGVSDNNNEEAEVLTDLLIKYRSKIKENLF